MVNTGFNRSLVVDWWSNGRLKRPWSVEDIYSIFIESEMRTIMKLKIVYIQNNTGLIKNVFYELLLLRTVFKRR